MQQLSRPYAGIKDIDTTGRVVQFYGSAFGNEDSDGDIIMPGAYTKTILENGPNSRQPRIKHLLQHDTRRIIGKFTELTEDQKGLLCTSVLADTQDAKDALALYGLDLFEHSVGFRTIKWEGDNSNPENYVRRLTELQLWEVSSVTWGANSDTPLVGIKAHDPAARLAGVDALNARMGKLFKALRTGNLQDSTYEQLQAEADSLQTAYKGLISLNQQEPKPEQSTLAAIEPSDLIGAFKSKLSFL
jgi:HK97 family phage prohead protease